MEFFFSSCGLSVAASICAGVVIGLIYDMFLIKRRSVGGNAVTLFIEDVVFCIIGFLVLSVFVLKANYGDMRWYAPMLAYIGLYVYQKTVGRMVLLLGVKTVGTAVKLVCALLPIFVYAPLRFVARVLKSMFGRINAGFGRISDTRKKRRFIRAAGKGFKI